MKLMAMLSTARGVERNQADVVLREGLAAVLQLHQHPGGILQIEHRHAEHFPVGIARCGSSVYSMLQA